MLCVSRKFYGFDDKFDPRQLMVRSKESVKNRNMYMSSKGIRNVAINNQNHIKVWPTL